ncbi:MAG TPA: outer membrane lipoprotein carrier protein LolA, partial [Rectinemataceae bacterium]|nr:outer membrane lipoprotein carrier protein LolA [Rectinemataceae bacterium]
MKSISLFLLLTFAVLAAKAQDITTADSFFAQMADRYAQIKDYEGHLAITLNADKAPSMTGSVSFKAPSLLRIDFIQPPDQVIAFDGTTLTVYIPSYRAVLSQTAGDKPGGAGGASLASSEGL